MYEQDMIFYSFKYDDQSQMIINPEECLKMCGLAKVTIGRHGWLSLKIIKYNMAGLSLKAILAVWLALGIIGLVCGQVVPNGTSTTLANINMTQLLQSLNMTQGDLKQMQQDIANNHSSTPAASDSSQFNNQPAPANTSNQGLDATKTTTNVNTPASGSNQIDANGLTDLSLLQQQLGLAPALAPRANVSVQSTSNSTSANQTSKPAQTSPSSHIALNGPIPIASAGHLSSGSQTTAQTSSAFALLDLSSLEQQLGLAPAPSTHRASNQNNSSQPQSTATTTPTSTISSGNSSSEAVGASSSASTSPSRSNSSSQASTNSSSVSPTLSSSNVSSSSNPPSNVSTQSSTASSNSSTTSTVPDQTTRLFSELARLQDMLDQLQGNTRNRPSSPSPSQNTSSGGSNQSAAANQTAQVSQSGSNASANAVQPSTTSANTTPVTNTIPTVNTSARAVESSTASANRSNQSQPSANPSLPEVIDISKANVIQSIYNQTQPSAPANATQTNTRTQKTEAAGLPSKPAANQNTNISLPSTPSNGSTTQNSQPQAAQNQPQPPTAKPNQNTESASQASSKSPPAEGENQSQASSQLSASSGQPSNVNNGSTSLGSNKSTFPQMIDLSKANVLFSIYNNSNSSNSSSVSTDKPAPANSSTNTSSQPSVSQPSATNSSSSAQGTTRSEANPNLPPVIDISKANVLFSIYNQTQSSSAVGNNQSKPSNITPVRAPSATNTLQNTAQPARESSSSTSTQSSPQDPATASTSAAQPSTSGSQSTSSSTLGPSQTPKETAKGQQTQDSLNSVTISTASLTQERSKAPETQTTHKVRPEQPIIPITQPVPPATTRSVPPVPPQAVPSAPAHTPPAPQSNPTPNSWSDAVASQVRASSVSRLDPRFRNDQNQGNQANPQQQASAHGNSQAVNQQVQPSTPASTPVTQPPQPSFNLQRQPQNTIQPYQSVQTSRLAVFTLRANYKTFASSYILSVTDPNLPRLQSFLSANYGNYVRQGTLIAGFKLYEDFDNAIQYQLLYETVFGTFNAFISYNPYTDDLILKSLSVISFPILDITLQNCTKPDATRQLCQVCNRGYRNFMGRCRLFQPACLQYLTDQCGACSAGFQLIKGICSK